MKGPTIRRERRAEERSYNKKGKAVWRKVQNAMLDSQFFVTQWTFHKKHSFSEMEFLNIGLTKGSSLLLHAIHSPFHLRILKKTILYSNPWNKITRVYSWIAFCRKEKWGQKTRQKLESEKTQVYARKRRLKRLLKNSISGYFNLFHTKGIAGPSAKSVE